MLAATVLDRGHIVLASTARGSRMHVHGCSTIRARYGTARAIALLSTSIACMSVEVQCMCNGPYTSLGTQVLIIQGRMPHHGAVPGP